MKATKQKQKQTLLTTAQIRQQDNIRFFITLQIKWLRKDVVTVVSQKEKHRDIC